MRTDEVSTERLHEIQKTYRELGLDPTVPGIRGASDLWESPLPVIVTPLLSNNTSFDD